MALDGERLNRRMHNKLWVADNSVAIFGSRNLGDEYFEYKAPVSFVDIDLLLVGPAVQQLSGAFDEYWNSGAAWPAQALGVRAGDEERRAVHEVVRRRADSCRTIPACRRPAL